MNVNLVIPRHEYRSLRDGRESISLSPEGKAALDRLATCSRSAAVDLAVRILDAAVCGDQDLIESVMTDLAKTTDQDGISWLFGSFVRMMYAFD